MTELDRLIETCRTREEYLIEKMRVSTLSREEWHEWLNMPYKKPLEFRDVHRPSEAPTADSFFFFPSSFPERD